jgi:ribosomal protein S30
MNAGRKNIGKDTKKQDAFRGWKKQKLTPRQKEIRKYRRTIEQDDDYNERSGYLRK